MFRILGALSAKAEGPSAASDWPKVTAGVGAGQVPKVALVRLQKLLKGC